MPSRRVHNKSRHGCPQCKFRRIKVRQLLFQQIEILLLVEYLAFKRAEMPHVSPVLHRIEPAIAILTA